MTPTCEPRKLSVRTATETDVVFVQGSSSAVFEGDLKAAPDLACGSCGQVLATRLRLQAMVDVLIECSGCRAANQTYVRTQGEPAAPRPVVTAPPGRYRIDSTVRLGKGVVASERSLLARWIETSPRPVPDETNDLRGKCRALVAEVEVLMGKVLVDLRSSHMRAVTSATPPKEEHRLIAIISQVEEAANSFPDNPLEERALASIAELSGFLDLARQWSVEPIWSELLPALKSPGSYPHTVVTLASASLLRSAGNSVRLEPRRSGYPPDLELLMGLDDSVAVEIKAPRPLQGPSGPLSLNAARELAEKHIRGAARQLKHHGDGVIVIGGFKWRSSDIENLALASRAQLARSQSGYPHVLAVGLVTIGARVEYWSQAAGGLFRPRSDPEMSFAASFEVIPNDRYGGSFRLQQ